MGCPVPENLAERAITARRCCAPWYSEIARTQIETTLARAKEVRSMAEKMITLGKRDDLHAKRQVFSFITKENVAKKVIDEIGPKYTDRDGGYTRIVENRRAPRRCCRNGHHRTGVSCQLPPVKKNPAPWRVAENQRSFRCFRPCACEGNRLKERASGAWHRVPVFAFTSTKPGYVSGAFLLHALFQCFAPGVRAASAAPGARCPARPSCSGGPVCLGAGRRPFWKISVPMRGTPLFL